MIIRALTPDRHTCTGELLIVGGDKARASDGAATPFGWSVAMSSDGSTWWWGLMVMMIRALTPYRHTCIVERLLVGGDKARASDCAVVIVRP